MVTALPALEEDVGTAKCRVGVLLFQSLRINVGGWLKVAAPGGVSSVFLPPLLYLVPSTPALFREYFQKRKKVKRKFPPNER
jgi:hypothetical protein